MHRLRSPITGVVGAALLVGIGLWLVIGRLGVGQTDPCNAYTCDGQGAQLNVAYRYLLGTHCGVLETRFDGRTFYVEALNPTELPASSDGRGTMTLLGEHLALYQDPAGDSIRFVDSPPGVIGNAYPFTAHVLAGGNTLIDEHFAGRVWHPQGTLLGVNGPPYGNGNDAWTAVLGTMTLLSGDESVFNSEGGTSVTFVRIPFECM